jgi:hypothetical protein
MTIKVFQLDDVEWWAGNSLEDCLKEARKHAGQESYEDAEELAGQLSDSEMQRLKFVDEDGTRCTFEERLRDLVAEGVQFPCLFAATEW